MRTILFFITTLSLFVASTLAHPSVDYQLILRNSHRSPRSPKAAAQCCAEGPKCDDLLAISSGMCEPGRWMSQQPERCQETACSYCLKSRSLVGKTRFMICRSEAIQKNCFRKSHTPTAEETPVLEPTQTPVAEANEEGSARTVNSGGRPGRCVYKGSNGLVYIPARRFKTRRPWAVLKDSIVWKPGGNGRIDRKGSGTTCLPFKSDRNGHHYVTMFTSSPDRTEHNDAWMKVSSGVDLYRPGPPGKRSWRQGGKDFFKVYQNTGKNKMEKYVVTVNHNPHQLITRKLRAGRTYHICIAGRSSRFRIYSIALVACNGGEDCSRFKPKMKRALAKPSPSRCVPY